MLRDVHMKETDTRQTVIGQEQPPVEEPPAPVSGARESRQEGMPAGISSAAPPTPPSRPLVARRRQKPSGGRWALGIGLVVLGALSWVVLGFALAYAGSTLLLAMLIAAVPAVTCLVAGWLLRSWQGLVAALVVYLALGAIGWILFGIGSSFLTVEFVLDMVLPAAVMSAIGTAIGMARAR